MAHIGAGNPGIAINASGTTITTSGVSARTTIPNNAAGASASGRGAKWVRVAASAAAYVKLGDSSVTAAAGDIMVQPGDAVILAVNGATNIAAIQVAAAGIVQISALEDD